MVFGGYVIVGLKVKLKTRNNWPVYNYNILDGRNYRFTVLLCVILA